VNRYNNRLLPLLRKLFLISNRTNKFMDRRQYCFTYCLVCYHFCPTCPLVFWLNLTYEVLARISENLNISCKLFAVKLLTTRCWTSLPNGIELCSRVHFYGRSFKVVLMLFWFVKSSDVKEHRTYIEFCSKLCKTAAETHEVLKEAFDDNALGHILDLRMV
jgi:hypothetical protein